MTAVPTQYENEITLGHVNDTTEFLAKSNHLHVLHHARLDVVVIIEKKRMRHFGAVNERA